MVGETIGNYKIVEQLGQGGMATVYRAVHLQLDLERAIKIIRPEFGADAAFRTRFQPGSAGYCPDAPPKHRPAA